MPLILVSIIGLAALFAMAGLASASNALSKALIGFFQGFGPILNWFGNLISPPLTQLTRWISHECGVAFQGLEQIGVRWLDGLNSYVNYMGEHTLKWASELYGTVEWLTWHYIPKQVAAALRATEGEIGALWRHMPLPARVVIHLPRISKAWIKAAIAAVLPGALIAELPLLKWLARHKAWLAHVAALAGGIALAPGYAIPRLWRGIDDLRKWKTHVGRRLHRLEKLLGMTGLAIAIASVLRIPSFRCLTTGPIGKVSRALCGLSSAALQDLLGLIVDALILTNICEVITIMEDGLSLISGPLDAWIGTADAMFVHCGYDLGGTLPDPPLSLPPLTGVSLSLP